MRHGHLTWLLTLLALAVGCSEDRPGPQQEPSPDMGTADMGAADMGSPGEVWRPSPGLSWQIQYSGDLQTELEVEVFNLDLFDTDVEVIQGLQARGVRVMCYFSAGSWENWRPDKDLFPAQALGDPLEDWPGERWLDIRDPQVRSLHEGRLDLAVQKGCDAVDPDNVNGSSNDTGFALTRQDQLDFNLFLAQAAHARGLSIGLKNAQDLAPELVDDFDWALNEECIEFEECQIYVDTFLAQGKAVYNIEYQGDLDSLCAQAQALGLDTLKKTLDLDAARQACPR